jgi:acetolactate synthase-1/2/3 large subunit
VPKVADVIAGELGCLGCRHFFLLTGGDHALFVALRRAGVAQVLARSEDAAVYMADAYARMTQGPAWVYGQYGPGAANIAGSLAEPYWSSSPVIALTSSMRRQHRFRLEYQELDQPQLFTAVTKWQAEASTPQQIVQTIRAGALRAVSGTPGPVYVGIANDLTDAEFGGAVPAARPDLAALRFPLHRPRADGGAVDEAARLLLHAKRPVVLAGNGVHASGAEREVQALAERLQMPVITSLSGKGSIPEQHRLAAGVAGRYSRNYANACLKDADLVLAVGSRLGGLVTDSYRLISPAATVIQVDVTPEVIGHNFPVAVGVHADAREFLRDLAPALARHAPSDAGEAERAAWAARVDADRAAWRTRFADVAAAPARVMRPESVIAVLQDALPARALMVADTGYAAAWVGALYEVREAGRGIIRSDGSLGWAFPAGLGAKLAAPDRPVVVVTGDGGFGYHVGELETAVRLRLPVTTIVLNNSSLALEWHLQEMIYGEGIAEVDDYAPTDHAAIARAFGATGIRAETPAQLREALSQAARATGPVLIDAIIDKAAIAPITRFDSIRTREL